MFGPMLASALGALALAAAPDPTAAQERAPSWHLELALPVAVIGGHTTYRIEDSDAYGSVASELEFPLDGVLSGVQAQLANGSEPGKGRVVFRVSGLLSLTDAKGTVKDSDWITGVYETYDPDTGTYRAPHDGKDIYSTSRGVLETRVIDARAEWELDTRVPGLVVAPMVGVLYQRFHFDVYDANQVGYGSWAPDATVFVPGKVLDYGVTYWARYVGVRAALGRGGLGATADLWFSPWASADDRDDHLARAKLSTSSASGTAWQASVGARLAFGAWDALQVQASLLRLDTSGTQHQSFYAGPYAGQSGSIPSKLTSSRTTFLVLFVHRLGS